MGIYEVSDLAGAFVTVVVGTITELLLSSSVVVAAVAAATNSLYFCLVALD